MFTSCFSPSDEDICRARYTVSTDEALEYCKRAVDNDGDEPWSADDYNYDEWRLIQVVSGDTTQCIYVPKHGW